VASFSGMTGPGRWGIRASAHTSGPLTHGTAFHQGDATYLIVKNDGSLANFGLNAVCTHLGCVVPWNAAENKFKCPCHGSQYNDEGKVIRGPAPLVRSTLEVVILASLTMPFRAVPGPGAHEH